MIPCFTGEEDLAVKGPNSTSLISVASIWIWDAGYSLDLFCFSNPIESAYECSRQNSVKERGMVFISDELAITSSAVLPNLLFPLSTWPKPTNL
jgi:hypothetical protein